MAQPDLPHTQALPAELAAALAQAARRLGPFARHVQWYEEVPSTNDLAGALAVRGAREGVVVIADSQTAGRGRQGRVWASPAGTGLYVSVILRPDVRVAPLLTLAAGVAIADAIRAATGLTTVLKWPNDVYAGSPPASRKLAGILAESGASEPAPLDDARGALSDSRRARHVILGFGINVGAGDYPPEIAARATSLETELGRTVERGAILAECLASLAARYDDLQHDRAGAILMAWREYARPLLGRAVEWDESGQRQTGFALDVDHSGALVVRTPAGMSRVVAGEVRWV